MGTGYCQCREIELQRQLEQWTGQHQRECPAGAIDRSRQSIFASNPNLSLSLPGGISVIINQRSNSSGGTSGSMTVNCSACYGTKHRHCRCLCQFRYHLLVTKAPRLAGPVRIKRGAGL